MQISNISFSSNNANNTNITNSINTSRVNYNSTNDTFVSEHKNNKKKYILPSLIGVGVLATVGILFKNKIKINKAEIQTASTELLTNPIKYILETPEEKLMPEFQKMFSKLKGLKGRDFTEKSYELISDILGYKDLAPKLGIKSIDVHNAYFVGMNGTIDISEKYIEQASNTDLLGTIIHEFTHFIQTSDIIRTQNLGPKAYIEWGAKSEVYQASKDSELLKRWFMKYDGQKLSQKEVSAYIDKYYQENARSFNQAFYDRILNKKGEILPNTELANQSEEHLNALNKTINILAPKQTKGYEIWAHDSSFYKEMQDEHFKNHFEATAYKVEAKIKNLCKKFSEQNN